MLKLARGSNFERRFREALSRRSNSRQSALLRLSQTAARPNFENLWDSEFRVFSQWGEDGILFFLTDSLKIWRPRMLEVGAGDFLECNSRYLAQELAGRAVVVDADPQLLRNVVDRPDAWKSTIVPMTRWVTPGNITQLMDEAAETVGALDILSMDIDGNDYWVLEAAALKGLSILVLEYNPLFGSALPLTVPRNDSFSRYDAHFSSLYYGASLRALVELAASRDFSFIGTNRVGNNAFFVSNALVDQLPIPKPDPEDLSKYVDWSIRDSRSEHGGLNLLTGQERLSAIAGLPLVRLDTGEQIPLDVSLVGR